MSTEFLSDLTPVHFANFKRHKYSASGTSILDPILNIWWNFAINYLPKSLSPNMVTFTGLLIMLSSSVLFVCYSPDMVSKVPGWVHLYGAVALFMYQTLDALDGKQARRLNCSSPLGEIVDHGCDAVTLVLVIINCGCTTCLGRDPFLFKCIMWMLFLYLYFTHWCYYVTGVFHFSYFNVTEGQLGVILLHLIAFFCGQEIFHRQVFTDYILIRVLLGSTIAGMLLSIPGYFIRIFFQGAGKNGSSVSNTSVISPSFPYVYLFVLWGYVERYSQVGVGKHLLIETTVLVGSSIAVICTKMLTCSLTHAPFPLQDVTLFYHLILMVVVLLSESSTVELTSLYLTLVMSVTSCFSFLFKLIFFFSRHLSFPVITLPKKNSSPLR